MGGRSHRPLGTVEVGTTAKNVYSGFKDHYMAIRLGLYSSLCDPLTCVLYFRILPDWSHSAERALDWSRKALAGRLSFVLDRICSFTCDCFAVG